MTTWVVFGFWCWAGLMAPRAADQPLTVSRVADGGASVRDVALTMVPWNEGCMMMPSLSGRKTEFRWHHSKEPELWSPQE